MVYRSTKIKTSELISENAKFVKTLATARSRQSCKHLIHNASTNQLLALVEIALNLLRGRVPIRANQKQSLVHTLQILDASLEYEAIKQRVKFY